jgi:hypothetical protein
MKCFWKASRGHRGKICTDKREALAASVAQLCCTRRDTTALILWLVSNTLLAESTYHIRMTRRRTTTRTALWLLVLLAWTPTADGQETPAQPVNSRGPASTTTSSTTRNASPTQGHAFLAFGADEFHLPDPSSVLCPL